MGSGFSALFAILRSLAVAVAFVAALSFYGFELAAPLFQRTDGHWAAFVHAIFAWAPACEVPAAYLVIAFIVTFLAAWYVPFKFSSPTRKDPWFTAQYSFIMVVLMVGTIGLGLWILPITKTIAMVVAALVFLWLIFEAARSSPRFSILFFLWAGLILGTDYLYRAGRLPADMMDRLA